MSTKDLFKKGNKVLTKSQEAKIKSDLESTELVRDVVRANNKFHSHIDYSKPENFAFYGSAQKYYEDSFNRVYQTYPYDGSLSEKEKWFHDSSELDLWILDNAYPKTAGHVKLGTNQSIVAKGGPNNQPGITAGEKEELSKQFPVKQGNSNIWDTSIYRNSNLYIDGALGNTIEFWAKLDASVSNTAIVRLATIKNTAGATFSLAFNRNNGYVGITYTDADGDGFDNGYTDASFLGETWAHYSFSVINTATQVKAEFYKNGVLVKTVTADDDIAAISQEGLSLVLNGTTASTQTVNGLYLDEFRFWKRARTAEEIGRNWLTNIHGGTNTDDNKYNTENRKVDLGIYYKFNEGVTGDASIDTTVLDYSGRISNGTITNYTTTARATTSAFDESGLFEVAEEKDLIIYSSHPDFISSKKAYTDKGLAYDYNNNSSIYHTMPAWIIEEDEVSGENTKELTQVMSSYFDSAQVKIKELVNLKDVEYHTLEERTNKPYSLIRKTLESAGMVVPDLFTEASAFEEILSRGEQEKFEEKLQDVKNTIYQNIYNNLSYIYKSKGTEKAFRNLIRCFGIDDELLKVNMYSDGADYLLEDSRRTTAIKKKFVDFNNADRDQGLIYTKEDPSNADSNSYIRGVGYEKKPNLSFTFETEVIFPKRVASDHPGYDVPTNLEEHIAYLGEYRNAYTANDLFDLKAVKENSDALSENVKFVLTMDGQTLETQFFKSVYENSKWNLAVRLVPKKSLSGVVSGGSTTDYRAELYCVRMLADVVEDEETVTADITEANARVLLAKDKYVSIGALHSSGNPEVESLDNDTRVKISSTLFWYDNVTNEEIRAHASDASNFGRLHPSEEAYSHDAEFATIQIPKRDTLAMHWDFSEVSTTDGSGEFIVNDLSQGNTINETDINEKSIQFSADGDTIDIADSDNLSFTDGAGTDKPFSISAWVKVGNIATDSGVIISRRNRDGAAPQLGEWLVEHVNGKLKVYLYADKDYNAAEITVFSTTNRLYFNSSVANLTSNTWHFVTVTYDGSENTSGLKAYKDGTEITTNKTVTNTNYSGMPNYNIVTTIGGTDSPTTNTLEDYIADTVVFDKELSAAEVTEIYNSGKVKDMSTASTYNNIISWWKMGDGTDATGANGIKDYVGSNNGTLVGTAAIASESPLSDVEYSGTYGWFTNLIGRQVTGLGKHFTSNDKQIVNREYVHSAKHRPPEVINSEDLIEIRSQDDLTFTKDAQITTHFFAAEKSMYQVISDDMINLFATIVEFNDLIGQPVNRYRMEYKTLEKFRARYFEKVNNVPSLEKYIELYKWIDSSIGLMIQELIPVSSNFSADLRNMVESHVLERNKYWTKFPTLEMSGEPPMGVMRGINELTYSWKEGHAPVGSETTEDDKFLWGDKRVNASDITTGDSDVDDNREILRKVATRTTEGMVQVVKRGSDFVEENKPILRTPAGATYEGRTYANRALSKPYKLNLDIAKSVHGGVNYSAKTKDPNAFIRAATRIIPGADTVGVATTLATNPVTYEEWKKLYTVKRTVTVTIADTELNLTSTFDGDTIYPYYGYRDRDAGIDTTAIISGHHNDSYGEDAEIPMQGPFTETWVGGNQHRHVAPFTSEIGYFGKFNGSNSKIIVSDHDSLSFTDGQGFSTSFWFNADALNSYTGSLAGFSTILFKATPSAAEYYVLIWNNAILLYLMDSATNVAVFYFDADFEVGQWYNVVISYDGGLTLSSTSAYVNGEEKLSISGAASFLTTVLPNTSADLFIGNASSAGYEFDGKMKDIVIVDGSVSSSEANEFLSTNLLSHSRYSDFIGWWKLRGDSSSEVDSPTKNGSDTAVTYTDLGILVRPEFYLDDSGTLKHPQEVNSDYPAARYTRDEVAKRPVNVRNIKTNTTDNSPLGNYSKDYEVVQTSGRTQNNSWFVKSEGVDQAESNSPFISGATDYALPNRGRTGHVFTERFSAPGDPLTLSRGFLDTVAEEFSVYNSMNFRNLEERLEQQKRLYTHSGIYNGSQGYEDSVNGIPSTHKVNRNAFFRPVDGGCTTDYDNAYVSHQIPRSDLQYAFVTASIDYDKYRTGAADDRHPHDQCAADKIPVLFSGYYDEIHVQKGNEGYNAPYADFQGGGWRFIRNVEKAAVMNQRRTNTYSQLTRTPRIGIEDRSITSYIEPAVVWNKPNTHYILNEQAATLTKRGETPSLSKGRNTRPVTYSYSNNLETFSNQDLADAIDLEVIPDSQFSDTLFDIFSKAELLFSHSVAREIIFPRHKNVGLKKTRTRTKFDTYKFFWKDKMFDRVKCSNTTKLGYEMTPEFKRLFKQKFSVDVMDSFHFHQTDSTDNEYYKVIGDLTYMGEDRMRHMITRKDLDLADSSHPLNGTSSTASFLGLEGICEAQATSSDIVPVYSSSEITRNKTAPIPSPQLYHNPYNESYKESEGWVNRKPITSGQKANYNDYDSFSEEVKLAAQNYGLVSEFRISEHMDKYILENGGNFRAKNYDFLTLDGASHDGESHTLSSGTSIKETSTFYSLKKEDDSLAIAAYPTSSTDTSLVKNNAEGFFGYNPIYTRTNSTFDITNSINSEVEILASNVENYISIAPYQDGVSAAGKFNLSVSDEDWVEIGIDNFTQDGLINETFPTRTYLNFSPSSYNTLDDIAPPSPVVFSVWAQPETLSSGETQTSFGLFNFGSLSKSVSLFSKYNFSQGHASYQALGVTLVLSDGSGDPDEGLPGTTLTDSSSVYTFFTTGGSPAELNPNVMNNVVLQIVPPEPTSAASTSYEKNYLVKAYLNGVELYGAHIMELESANWNSRNSGGQSISAYSPCPIGEFEGTSNPWFEEYDVAYAGFLNGLDNVTSLRLGTADHANSRNNISAGSFKFRGLLDEFTIFRGILPSSSITAIYNNGVPNNVNELVANGQIVGNGLYEGTGSQSFIINGVRYSYPVPATVDNGEFDLGGKYYSNFESITSSGVVPTGWVTNESDETPANGPTVQQSTLSAGNSVFALRGYLDLYSDVDNPPGAHTAHTDDHFRWIQHPQAFETGIIVSFKAYEGRVGGDYGLTEPPDSAKGEYLWLQYKVGTGGTWQTAGTPLQPGVGGGGTSSIWDLQTTVTRTISGVGESSSDPIYLRWISYAETTNNTDSDNDTWGIDDIEIKESGITNDQYTAAEAQRIQILTGSTPFVKHTDFDNNYSVAEQQEIEASLPVWHRIGVPSYDKVVTQGQWDDEFFSSYVHTDDINFIEAADSKHDELGLETIKKVRLKVNAIKKLLPYEGFYPQDRTVQLANLFVEKISPDILHNEKVYKNQAIQAALQHFFAPGILYNSIKAGIACDWVTYTNESGMEPSYFGQTIQVFDTSGNPQTKYLKDATPYWFRLHRADVVDPYTLGSLDPARIGDTIPTGADVVSHLYGQFHQLDFGQKLDTLVTTNSPNKRLPFESLLNPVEYLLDGTNNERYKPDPSVEIYVEKKSNQHFLMNSSYYNSFFETIPSTGNYDEYCYPYFELSGDSAGKKDFRYELAMNNFLSETVKFFIKEEQLSSFSSRPENEFSAMTSGSTYYMDVALRQSKESSVVKSPGSLGGRYFGPPSGYVNTTEDWLFIDPKSGSFEKIEDPAYAPYTPPYFYGESVARIAFTATETKKYTLDEILEQSTVQYENKQAASLFRGKNLSNTSDTGDGATQDPFDGDFENSAAWTSKMPLDSSINLFGKTKISRQEFDADGNPTAISSANNTELDTWVIYTKFECPLFDFSDSSNASDEGTLDALGINKKPKETLSKTTDSATYDYTSSYLNTQNTERFTTDKRTGSGIWAGYGNQEDGKGVVISIRESFPEGTASKNSLIDVCGFTPETKQVGRVADEKEITEAVIMIPFLDEPVTTEQKLFGGGSRQVYATTEIDDRNFIKIDKLEYRRQKRKLDKDDVVYTNEEGTEIRETSITSMIEGMRNYNVPPLYDFETFDQDPFVMYFFEFKHTLDREDLSNIWQGVQPKIAKEAKLDSVEIDHEINPYEFFGNIGELPEGIRWMTFKVKRKAEKSYYKMTQDSRDDSRFKFDFEVGTKEPEYGYNYPYDYFTMLEKVQVEINSEKEVEPLEQDRIVNGEED